MIPLGTNLEIGDAWIDCTVRQVHALHATVTMHPVEEGSDISDHVRSVPDQIQVECVVSNQPIDDPQSHLDGAAFTYTNFELDVEYNGEMGTKSVPFDGPPVLGWLSIVPFVGNAYSLVRNNPRLIPRQKLAMTVPDAMAQGRFVRGYGMAPSRPIDRVAAVHEYLRTAFLNGQPITVITALAVYRDCVIVDLLVTRDAKSGSGLFFSATLQVIRTVKTATGLPVPVHVRAKPAQSRGTQNTAPVQPGEVSPATQAITKQSSLKALLSG